MATPHAKLCAEIAKYLKSLGPDCWFYRPNQSGYGRKGIPDFIGMFLGRGFGLEAKCGQDKLTAWQTRELDAIQRAGGWGLEIRDVETLSAILR